VNKYIDVNAVGLSDVRCTLFALIFLPKLIHAAARIACDSGPTCYFSCEWKSTNLAKTISGRASGCSLCFVKVKGRANCIFSMPV